MGNASTGMRLTNKVPGCYELLYQSNAKKAAQIEGRF